jgi:dipeptidyl aminopeptidase/acylaminoacyl peptidase
MQRATLAALGLLVVALVGGCGGSPPGNGASSGGDTVAVGSLLVNVASAAGFKTTILPNLGASSIAFTALWGSNIQRLQQMGNGKIAYTSDRDGNEEIYAMHADGTWQSRLTTNAATDRMPAWSPDGAKIAFASNRDGNFEIYTMNANGTGVIRLVSSAGTDFQPAWSPDGKRIAFASNRDGNYEIYVMNANGSGQTRLTTNPYDDNNPCWSPDSRQIASDNLREGYRQIYVMNVDGSGQRNLSDSALFYDYDPSWSPNGTAIAITRSAGAVAAVAIMGADGGDVGLSYHLENDRMPTWSPDSRKIAFQRSTSIDGGADICVVNTDGSGLTTNLTASSSFESYPAWCPAPALVRGLIGPAGSDGGSAPPFGTQRPLVIVGLNAEGLQSATTVDAPALDWASLTVSALSNIGTSLAGVAITGNSITSVIEDRGRAQTTRVWPVSGTPATGAVLIFFSGETGKVSSVIASSDIVLASAGAGNPVNVQLAGGQVVLRGDFRQACSAADPRRNLVSGAAKQVTLDSRTGEVLAVN